MTSEQVELVDFGKYGRLAIGTPSYADMTPHHQVYTSGGDYIRNGDRPYVSTYSPGREGLLCRILEERDPTAETRAAVAWCGDEDGENGRTYLVRMLGSVVDLVRIPDSCVDSFEPDVSEEKNGLLWHYDFSAILRGRAND